MSRVNQFNTVLEGCFSSVTPGLLTYKQGSKGIFPGEILLFTYELFFFSGVWLFFVKSLSLPPRLSGPRQIILSLCSIVPSLSRIGFLFYRSWQSYEDDFKIRTACRGVRIRMG